MNLYQLCREAALSPPMGAAACLVGGICTDSRRVRPGDLFICIPGLHQDGHRYAAEAVEKGAVALLAQNGHETALPTGVPVILTEDVRGGAAMLYDAWYGHPTRNMKLVAVTGTNGKTSVTYMLRAIFESAMYRCGLIGTVDCRSSSGHLDIRAEDPLANMTTPDPEELYRMLSVMAKEGVEYVFMEATSHALALHKLEPLRFEAAVFTNLTPEHLDFHGDMEQYFLAKSRLFSRCQRAIVNVDDAYGARLCDSLSCPAVRCSVRGAADVMAQDVVDGGARGSEYVAVSRNCRFGVRTPIPGSFTVCNTLLAAACALSLGVAPSVITGALGALCGIAGRMERVKLGVVADFSVFVDYAHTPDALENLLRTARSFARPDQRLILLFGCGGDRDRSKRTVMGRIAAELADLSVVTSDNSRSEEPMSIIEEIVSRMPEDKRVILPDRGEAIRYVIREARPGDIILLAGKGHEEYEIDKNGKHPFSEKALVMEAAMRYHGGEAAKEERKDQ